ncbi:MAG: nadD [Acidobacteria bacterium]|nr:nadD [Acidobacteriota bacterium]
MRKEKENVCRIHAKIKETGDEFPEEEQAELTAPKIGVFGGTFNPIHLGHLHIANRAQRTFGLSRIYFVVATEPPHKKGEELPPICHRYAMVSLATAGYPSFIPSLVELETPASPFTIHTMDKLARKTGSRKIMMYFIAGGDSLSDIASWKNSEELLSTYNFIFVVRPRISLDNPCACLPEAVKTRVCDLTGFSSRKIPEKAHSKICAGRSSIFITDFGALDISASGIRKLAAGGRRLGHLVSPAVQEYIQKHKLYGER